MTTNVELVDGQRSWAMERDEDGHRTYKIKHLVKGSVTDGPYNVINCEGLPVPGSTWDFDDDVDPWATCKSMANVQLHEHKDGDPHEYWIVEQIFSTKPDKNRCKTYEWPSPLTEPDEISGGFVKFTEQAEFDRYGFRILNSAHEQLNGPANEWDANRPQVRIKQNVPYLNLYMLTQMVDTLNAYDLWGLPPRTIKLSNVSWVRKFYGNCYIYYERTLEFDIRYRRLGGVVTSYTGTGPGTGTSEAVYEGRYETFDRYILDEGTKVLRGRWNLSTGRWEEVGINGQPPNPNNPAHFIRYQDPHGNLARVILNGRGLPFDRVLSSTGTGTGEEEPGEIFVERYGQSDFLLLGVPSSIE